MLYPVTLESLCTAIQTESRSDAFIAADMKVAFYNFHRFFLLLSFKHLSQFTRLDDTGYSDVIPDVIQKVCIENKICVDGPRTNLGAYKRSRNRLKYTMLELG